MKLPATTSRRAMLISAVLVAVITAVSAVAFAASLGISSQKMTLLRPTELPSAACSAPGTQTVATSKDSWISQGSPSQNKGTDSALYVMTKSSSNERTLVGFSLPTLPSDCSVTGATLRLRNDAPSGTRTIQAYRIAATWAENTVTWTNQPATAGSAAESQVPSGAGWQNWTVTTQVQAMYASGAYGFLIRDKTENCTCDTQQKYLSRESGSSTDAELIVTWG